MTSSKKENTKSSIKRRPSHLSISEDAYRAVLCQSSPKPNLTHEERLKLAMMAMHQGDGLVYTQAVKLFDVKRSTLHDHMSSKCVKFTKGRYPLLSTTEEKRLLKMLANVHSRGYLITPFICRRAAFMYAKLCNYRLALMANREMAGRKWFAAFLKRNNVAIEENLSNNAATKGQKSRRRTSKRKCSAKR